MPPALNKRALNSNKEPQQTTSQEMECTLANQEKSPPSKKKPPSETSALESACSFEDTAAGTSREISMLASKFAEVLSERAAADYTQMKELEGILTQARNLDSYLKEKKSHLRQTLALISDKLMG
uniref:Testis expressed 12 n=1 Tax=Amphiprion ocellaris TaxID=80972 RepID=A0AAQ6A300_AMPOC